MAHLAKARAGRRRTPRESAPGLSTGPANFDRPSACGRVGSARAQSLGGNVKLILLFAPCVLALWVPLYNSISPVLFGIPFFYWFQLVLVPISALAIVAADRIGKN
jgi:Protein of unknown function (DUF3311)